MGLLVAHNTLWQPSDLCQGMAFVCAAWDQGYTSPWSANFPCFSLFHWVHLPITAFSSLVQFVFPSQKLISSLRSHSLCCMWTSLLEEFEEVLRTCPECSPMEGDETQHMLPVLSILHHWPLWGYRRQKLPEVRWREEKTMSPPGKAAELFFLGVCTQQQSNKSKIWCSQTVV